MPTPRDRNSLRAMLRQVSADSPLQRVASQIEDARHSEAVSQTLESLGLESRGASQGLDALRGGELEGTALEALDTIARNGFDAPLSDDQQFALEAIVLPKYRPVVNIVADTFSVPPDPWTHLGGGLPKRRIDGAIRSVGRIEVPHHPFLIPYAGTGFVVGKLPVTGPKHLLMTNRHVAQLFATGLGQRNLAFNPGQAVEVDFKREIVPTTPQLLMVEAVVMIHPFWDMALLRVVGLPDDYPVLSFTTERPEQALDRDVVVIGYPAQDPRNDVDLQNRIFGGVYQVKRMQPGKLKVREDFESFGHLVNAVTHDSSTLGGNSGSAVIEFADPDPQAPARVIGLHFAGTYLKANYAVPMFDLAQDGRVVDAGVNFVGPVEPRTGLYGALWAKADASESAAPNVPTRKDVAMPSRPTVNNPRVSVTQSTSDRQIDVNVSVSISVPAALAPPVAQTAARSAPTAEGLFGGGEPPSIPDNRFSRESLAATTFDWKTTLSLSLASRQAYGSGAAVIDTVKNLWGVQSCEFFDVDDTQCFVAATDNVVLVAFRGTTSVQDWLADLNIFSTDRPYGTVHRGFRNAFAVVEPQLRAEVQKFAEKPVLITGHSLGGALAVIAAAEWQGVFDVRWLYTYGQPAVGKGSFPGFMNHHYGAKYIRVVNDDDIVPQIPPTYSHMGRLIHFDPHGGVSGEAEAVVTEATGVGTPPVMSEAAFDQLRARLLAERAGIATDGGEALGLEGMFPSFSDHSIERYLLKIALHAG